MIYWVMCLAGVAVSGYSNTDEESSSSASALRRPPYQTLTKDRMLKLQDHDIKQVAEMLNVSRPFGRTLLMHFNWDAQRLLEVFFDKGKDHVYKAAGLRVEAKNPDHTHPTSSKLNAFLCSMYGQSKTNLIMTNNSATN